MAIEPDDLEFEGTSPVVATAVVERGRVTWPLAVLAVLAVSAIVAVLVSSEPTDTTGSQVTTPTTERASTDSGGTDSAQSLQPAQGVDSQSADGNAGDLTPSALEATVEIVGLDDGSLLSLRQVDEDDQGLLAELAVLDRPIKLIVSPPLSAEPLLIESSAAGVTVRELPPIGSPRFDISGEWIAGHSVTTNGTARTILWAGRVDGAFEPVMVGTRGFAWHDTEPAVLGWVEEDALTHGQLKVAARDDDLTVTTRSARGNMRAFGDWGVAVQPFSFRFSTTVFDDTGETVIVEGEGRFGGRLPDGSVILAGGTEAPFTVAPDTGRIEQVEWLDADDHIWSWSAPNPAATVLLVDRDGFGDGAFNTGEIVRVNVDGSTEVLDAVDHFTDLAVSADGEVLAYVMQQPDDGAVGPRLVLHAADGTRSEVQLPDLWPGREWIDAIHLG